ncbi:MAG: hypothetical protein A2X49_16065 [Lentisphaerae bacterium GWF2_52_8]|nr:MAG: hypothetical protein A2X49_16065 [Lentisphaerae bacterium GWF2_52_8]
MDEAKFREVAEKLASGKLDLLSALAQLGEEASVADIGFAKLDLARESRCGFPEFIYGGGKTPAHIVGTVSTLREKGRPILVTRIAPEAAAELLLKHPDIEHDPEARTASLMNGLKIREEGLALIATAGTSDIGVALEAKWTLALCGWRAELIADAGVAGIHRLLASSEKLRSADVVIAVAGMEGALPSVIGGLVSCPVLAVPTSVGYGVSSGGFSALAAMLGSCANGVLVVNIDNGFGAACAAARILNSKYPKAAGISP